MKSAGSNCNIIRKKKNLYLDRVLMLTVVSKIVTVHRRCSESVKRYHLGC